ncbi:MAG: N-formylglutamate amidohydrolase [Victivallaceae bacterium]|nr:N-formylglutamate amidohydrolase [Victivallaceae bacterium]
MKESPVVIHIPHSSHFVPDFLRPDILLSDDELHQSLSAITDWRTRDLFCHGGLGERVVFPVSRLICDPERFRKDADEDMASRGMGAVYVLDPFLRPLRKFDPVKRELMLRLYYDRHHRRLRDAVSGKLGRLGRCLIVDAHSFPCVPLPYERHQRNDRPDICIGTSGPNTTRLLANRATRFFQNCGLSVSVNYPYAGSMVPLDYIGDARVQSLMVELNRGLFTTGSEMEASSRYGWMKSIVGRFLDAVQ